MFRVLKHHIFLDFPPKVCTLKQHWRFSPKHIQSLLKSFAVKLSQEEPQKNSQTVKEVTLSPLDEDEESYLVMKVNIATRDPCSSTVQECMPEKKLENIEALSLFFSFWTRPIYCVQYFCFSLIDFDK